MRGRRSSCRRDAPCRRGALASLRGVLAALLLLGVAPALAQSAGPFDMSGERSHLPQPATPAPPSPEEAGVQLAPALPAPATLAPASPLPAQAAAAQPEPAPSAPTPAPGVERLILPYDRLALEGEVDSRSWRIDVTRPQAALPATLTLAYRTALVVAPESSRLRLFLNNQPVIDEPLQATGDIGRISAVLPAGLLQAGGNLLRIQVVQRHRTDCSIASTYELRTEIVGAGSTLRFPGPVAVVPQALEDLKTVGADAAGVTHVRLVSPALGRPALTAPLLRLAQGLALLIGMPNQAVEVSATTPAPDAGPDGSSGTLTVLAGTADDLRPLGAVPVEAASRPVVAFTASDRPTLVVTGPTTDAIVQAVDSITELVDRPYNVRRMALDTARWSAPDTPLLFGGTRLRLSDLGVSTQEFSGRRFKADFLVGVPSDFFAEAYGQATLMLDAAYTSAVQPGSHLDVSVNGHIAATTPITTRGGEILRHLPIRIPLNNLRPGPNAITFEAHLATAADAACASGPASASASRFALFDSSEFVMPNYARIGQLPNLAALMGTAFPYNRAPEPTAVVLPETDPDGVSAAATLLGRMALSAGRVIPVEVTSGSAAMAHPNAVFVGMAAQMPSGVLGQTGLVEALRTTWKEPSAAPVLPALASVTDTPSLPTTVLPEMAGPGDLDTQATFDRWRTSLSGGGGWRGDISALQDWFQRTFQISMSSLRLLPSSDEAFDAPRGSTALLAQAAGPDGQGAWTVLTAPSTRLLREGAEALTSQRLWQQLSGHIVSYQGKTDAIQVQPLSTFSFVPTQPFSIGNIRLIAANWLSENILAFSVLLLTACVILGLATALFLAAIGRRPS